MIQRARAASPSFGEARRDGSAEARTRPTEGLADEPQLASLMLALGRSEALKSDFVATMSHELRSPLNIIMGYVDLVLDGEFGSVTSEQNKVLGYVAKSAVELLDLINAMLTMSRLEKGETALHSETVALAELLTETAAHTFEAQNTHGLGLILDVPPTLGSIHTDPTKLKDVVRNLVANALKFTLEGSVTVAARAEQGGVTVSVSDTGIGIPPEVAPFIYEPFHQGDSPMTRRFGGVGLGLYLVRRLLHLLGGTIAMETTVGRGSKFTISIPDRPPAPSPAVLPQRESRSSEDWARGTRIDGEERIGDERRGD